MKFFENRIKPLAFMQLSLIIPLIIFSILMNEDSESVNHLYVAMVQIIAAVFWLLMGIENFLLKHKFYAFVFFAATIFFISLAAQNFEMLK